MDQIVTEMAQAKSQTDIQITGWNNQLQSMRVDTEISFSQLKE